MDFTTNNPFDLSDVFGTSEQIKAQSADHGEWSTHFRPGQYPEHPTGGILTGHNEEMLGAMKLANDRQVANARTHAEAPGNRPYGVVPPSMTPEEYNSLMLYTVGSGLVLVVAYMWLRGR